MILLAQAHGVPVFEDDCYADLTFDGKRPPALMAVAREAGWDGVIHIGSFSKSIAPALRVGFLVANWDVMSRLLALKQDAGSGALEQMVLAEFCATQFDAHLKTLTKALSRKADVLVEALAEHFGTAAEFEKPVGGIFLWVRLPEQDVVEGHDDRTVDVVRVRGTAHTTAPPFERRGVTNWLIGGYGPDMGGTGKHELSWLRRLGTASTGTGDRCAADVESA